eukprot:3617193-Rhodomonas_salina.1
MKRQTWVAGLVEEIIRKYRDRHGSKTVEGIDPGTESKSESGGEEGEDRPDAQPGKRGGSHQGMARGPDVLAGTKRLHGRHWMAKRQNGGTGNCVLCYATQPGKTGEKAV